MQDILEEKTVLEVVGKGEDVWTRFMHWKMLVEKYKEEIHYLKG